MDNNPVIGCFNLRIMSQATPVLYTYNMSNSVTIVLRSACAFRLQKGEACVVIAVYSVAVEPIVSG